MSETQTAYVPVDKIKIRRRPTASIAVIGNPNSGKSTLFNRLTGLRQTTGNYPGVTVEKHSGILQLSESALELVDLPGIYCLGGFSADERIAVDLLLGRIAGTRQPDGLLIVLDATHLYQGLYLLQQLMEMELPMVVAMTMTDVATSAGIDISIEVLQRHLGGIPIYPVVATTGRGLDTLKEALESISDAPAPSIPESWPELSSTADSLVNHAANTLTRIDMIQALLHPESQQAETLDQQLGAGPVEEIREKLFGDEPPQACEARHRYRWVHNVLRESQHRAPLIERFGARGLRWMNRPWPATLMFFAVMALVFQAVFSWATPMMEGIDQGATWLAEQAGSLLPAGALSSFITDGVIAGVGSVIVFLPQILILFLFIIVLEDSGFLARAAFLMDRIMRTVGLSGQSVIPMLSSFACAVPAIMATRVIPDRRDRIATILAAPFMTCSARLPVYALLIAAFVPDTSVGWFNLQGLVLLGLYLLGIAGGLVTAWLLKRSALRGPKPHFALALPEFRWPNLQTVLIKLLERARVFLKRAGTVIFLVAIIVWGLAYFPRSAEVDSTLQAAIQQAESSYTGDQLAVEIRELENKAAADQLEQSYLGRAGKSIEPVFTPLGWDWRVSAAVIAGFPAREVVVAVMGTIYAVGEDAEEASLAGKLRSATWPDGRPIFTVPMVLGLLLFYAWCLQCAATIATIRRETNSWRWPLFAWTYMTIIGYVGALLIYQLGSLL
ncbi:MAG: ferrous iron transport protein B [Xanthomonadales bacterium]|nr:ferrous iron transport protein B [Gammaproteobacteria bacterium]MBT8054955.1 ferrous iron transport protein B [Gammaproteobacteria bacterium]NND56337.1 ferrous iron transport protein B [Xanthomonadales bacterium]NNK52877.1 ferrous iron transport protein B [Xanthomonadales bacterium]